MPRFHIGFGILVLAMCLGFRRRDAADGFLVIGKKVTQDRANLFQQNGHLTFLKLGGHRMGFGLNQAGIVLGIGFIALPLLPPAPPPVALKVQRDGLAKADGGGKCGTSGGSIRMEGDAPFIINP